jgi:UDP-glucose 4-epimerase
MKSLLLITASARIAVTSNLKTSTNVLESARINSAKRVHLASTVWVYNGAPDSDEAADETVPFHLKGAGHIYTSTKMACEMLCHNYSELYDLPFTVLRYGIPYGPRMREELLIPIFLKKALDGDPLTVAGKGEQYRKFVYVRDLAEAHVLAMSDEAKNEIYNLEGPRKVTVLEVAERIRDHVGEHVKIEMVPARPGDFGGKEVSAEKARRELSWKAEVDFEDGLAHTVQWFSERWERPLGSSS